MLPYAVITMTGQLGIELLGGAQHAEAVAIRQPEVGQHDAGTRRSAAPNGFGLIARLDARVWPCASSAWRSIARSESLSSTRRMGGSVGATGRLPEPAGRHARSARFFFDCGDGVLVVLDHSLQPIELGHGFLAILPDERSLRRVVASREVGRQRVDAALQRLRIKTVAIELVESALHPRLPVRLVLARPWQ